MDTERNCSFDMSWNIQLIREWIENQNLFFGRTDESFIAPYLEACDNDVEKTKRRIVRYYELRRLYPRLMRNRDILHERHAKLLRQKFIYSDIVKENDELPVVMTVKLSRLESDDDLCDAFRVLIFTIETGLLHSARFRKYGGITIFDLEDMKFTHALQLTPSISMQVSKCLFDGVPCKCCGILTINVGAIVRAAITVGSFTLPREIRKVLTISSGSWESVEDKVPPQCLPFEYGGTNGTLEENLESVEAIYMKWRDYLLDDERYGVNDHEQEF